MGEHDAQHDPVLPTFPVKKKKCIRRGERKSQTKHFNLSKHDNKWIILHSNIRGFNSKNISFQSTIKGVNPNVININELAFRKDKKLNIPGYVSYMGGVATCIKNDEKSFALKTHEGDDKDEFIVTRHNQFLKPINIINIYGEIESRSKRKDVEERWGRILEIVEKIQSNDEWVILIGDLNKQRKIWCEG